MHKKPYWLTSVGITYYVILTCVLCKDSREGSSQSHVGSNFIVLFFLK